MTPDLFLAILSMDAYNRTGNDVTLRGLTVAGNRIGNATLGLSLGVDNRGFFGQSYELSSGQK